MFLRDHDSEDDTGLKENLTYTSKTYQSIDLLLYCERAVKRVKIVSSDCLKEFYNTYTHIYTHTVVPSTGSNSISPSNCFQFSLVPIN